MEGRRYLPVVGIVLMCASVCAGLYLISDYYMDDDWPAAFGQICGKSVEDDCLYLQSHLNSIGIINYGSNIQCTTELNAGTQSGATYKFKFKRFDIEKTKYCNGDYVEFYNTDMTSPNASNLLGRYCGDQEPVFNSYIDQQYITVKFKTDGSNGKKGFRVLAIRTLPLPCPDDYFHCKAENRCIDARLKCDGTVQCDDETDEDDCSFIDKLIGAFLALGVSGLVGIGFLCVFTCTGVGVTVCICTCCRKQCDCLFKSCKCCKPAKGDNKVGDAGPEDDMDINNREGTLDEYNLDKETNPTKTKMLDPVFVKPSGPQSSTEKRPMSGTNTATVSMSRGDINPDHVTRVE